jgi:hypothetical protein
VSAPEREGPRTRAGARVSRRDNALIVGTGAHCTATAAAALDSSASNACCFSLVQKCPTCVHSTHESSLKLQSAFGFVRLYNIFVIQLPYLLLCDTKRKYFLISNKVKTTLRHKKLYIN